MNRKDISFASQKAHDLDDKEYWANAPVEEKFAMITYLRECFYGPEATTGRLPRLFEFVKRERR